MVTINGAVSSFTKTEFERIKNFMIEHGQDFWVEGEFDCTGIAECAMIEFDIDPDSPKGEDMFEVSFHVGEIMGWN